MCVFITAVPIIKLFACGEGDSGGQGSARVSVYWGCYYATALDIEVDPQRHAFGLWRVDLPSNVNIRKAQRP